MSFVIISSILFVSSNALLSKPLEDVSNDRLQAFGNLVSDNMVNFANRDIPSVAAYAQADGGWSNSLESVVDGHTLNYGQFIRIMNMVRNYINDGSASKIGDATTTLVPNEPDALDISYCILCTFTNIPGVGSVPQTLCLTTRKYFDDNLIVYKHETTSDNGFVYNFIFKFLVQLGTTLSPEGQSLNYFSIMHNPVLLTVIVAVILFTLCVGVAIGWLMSNACKIKKSKKVKGVKYDIADVSIVSEQEMLN
eukprot:547550_1